ncbi:MAG: serine--tRNA ligase [Alphaproteobacteria bacterium]|jgi:seryl-tRNA synthetase
MHDINFIRNQPEVFDRLMKRRGFSNLSAKILELDKLSRSKKTQTQQLKEEANRLAKLIPIYKKEGKDIKELLSKASELKAEIQAQANEEEVSGELKNFLLTLPNILQDDVLDGKDENSNKEIYLSGKPKKFNFSPKEHTDLGENLGMLNFSKAAEISGARFNILYSDLALLERALGNFMIDNASEFGFSEVCPPLLVNSNAMVGTGQLPKFEEDSFKTTDGRWLIPTAEVPVTNFVRDEILLEKTLPLRFTAETPCFRSEAGSAGKDTKGIVRQHQFYKVEVVSICTKAQAEEEHKLIIKTACNILEKLELPYRQVLLCSGDTGFASSKTIDIEVWLPGQNKYREISSCSYFADFQARRMNARYRNSNGEINFLHTLNGSALAVGRTLVAILENYQNQDGSINIPKALQPYMKNKTIIEKHA